MGEKVIVVMIGNKESVYGPGSGKMKQYKVPFEVGDTVHISPPDPSLAFMMIFYGIMPKDWCIVDEYPVDTDGYPVTYHRSWFAPISGLEIKEEKVEKVKEFISQPDKIKEPYKEDKLRQPVES